MHVGEVKAEVAMNGTKHSTLTLPSPAKERARGKRKANSAAERETERYDARAAQRDSLQEKTLDVVRNSFQGVTSDEIYKSIGCATIQSAYQICLELQKKGLVERLDSGVWHAVNA